MRAVCGPFAVADAVCEEPQFARSTQFGIEQLERASTGVARVCKRNFSRRDLLGTYLCEVGVGDVRLAPDLDYWRHVVAEQFQRDAPHRARVVRDIVAAPSIAACECSREAAMFVDQRQRDAVDLELDRIRRLDAKIFPHVDVKFANAPLFTFFDVDVLD